MPSRTKSNSLDPATIIKRLESLATTDDAKADEFLQLVKGEENSSKNRSRSKSPKRTKSTGSGTRRSRSRSKDPEEVRKMLEFYGVDAAEGNEYLKMLEEAAKPKRRTPTTSPKRTTSSIAA